MFEIGDIVRYKAEWCCCEEERKYLHIIREFRMNPILNTPTRVLIETINTTLSIRPTEVVEEFMIEKAC